MAALVDRLWTKQGPLLAWGEPIDVEKHQPAVEIKGATYTELAVYEQDGQFVAQCVVDV